MRDLPSQEKGEVPEDLRLVRAAAVDAANAAAVALAVAISFSWDGPAHSDSQWHRQRLLGQ